MFTKHKIKQNSISVNLIFIEVHFNNICQIYIKLYNITKSIIIIIVWNMLGVIDNLQHYN